MLSFSVFSIRLVSVIPDPTFLLLLFILYSVAHQQPKPPSSSVCLGCYHPPAQPGPVVLTQHLLLQRLRLQPRCPQSPPFLPPLLRLTQCVPQGFSFPPPD